MLITYKRVIETRERKKEEEEEETIQFEFLLIIMKSSAFLFILVLCIFFFSVPSLIAGFTPPAKFDGFVYKNGKESESSSIKIEAFFDPICPDSRDAWPPLKQALQYYSSHVSLIVHPFPLPYHDNSYLACRALHVVNRLNSSATYNTLELFFKHQEKFYNQPTHNLSRASVVDLVVKLLKEAVGNSALSALESGFKDRKTDLTTRVSFKYGCSRGVLGTPSFIVNGFTLPDAGSPIDYNGWRRIIDPLLGKQGRGMDEGGFHFF